MSDVDHTDRPRQGASPHKSDNWRQRVPIRDGAGVTANKHTLRCCHVCSSSVTEKVAFRTGGSKTRFVCAGVGVVIDEDGEEVKVSCEERFMHWESAKWGRSVRRSAADEARWERAWWHLFGSCAICAVPVYGNANMAPAEWEYLQEGFDLLPYCSEQCRRALISQRAKAARAAKRSERPCDACGRLFMPTRADAKTCSNRCRQAAHRKHKRGAAVWLSDMMRADGELPYLKEEDK
jgi:hypothetical protein